MARSVRAMPGSAHGLADPERAVRAELAGAGEGVDEMTGQRQHDGGGEPLGGQLDRRRQHLVERQPPVALVQGEPAVDGAGHLHAADVAPQRASSSSPRRASAPGRSPRRPGRRRAAPRAASRAPRPWPARRRPSPHRCGPTTAIAVPVATAASAAEPPRASMPRPADAASWSAAATMPRRPGPRAEGGEGERHGQTTTTERSTSPRCMRAKAASTWSMPIVSLTKRSRSSRPPR